MGVDYIILNMELNNSASLFSEITTNLWQGGTPDEIHCDVSSVSSFLDNTHNFTAVVTLDSYSQPVGRSIKELRYGFIDGRIERNEIPKLLEVADWAYENWQRGEKVLVRCQAGANRSGLIVAIVLMKDGYSAQEAIDLIRSKRPFALSNSEFVSFLRKI